jgi:hypothetical protein
MVSSDMSCKIHSYPLSSRKNMSTTEIHRELCVAVYGQNVMSEETVRQWFTLFKNGRTNIHDEVRSGFPPVLSDGHVQSVD